MATLVSTSASISGSTGSSGARLDSLGGMGDFDEGSGDAGAESLSLFMSAMVTRFFSVKSNQVKFCQVKKTSPIYKKQPCCQGCRWYPHNQVIFFASYVIYCNCHKY